MRMMKHSITKLLLLVAIALVAIGCLAQTAPATPPVAQPAPALTVSTGDLLDVAVFDAPELSAKARVDEKGNIALPVCGAVSVQGLTAEGVAGAVETRLRENDIVKNPHVTVLVLEFSTQGVTVTGEVKNPGIYPLLGRHGLIDLISAAGGTTPTAGKAVTVLHRADSSSPEIVTLETKPGAVQSANIDLRPGDTVVVSRAGVVYVVGDVGKPGGFLIENNDRLTLLQAIALAQGVNRTAAQNRVKLIRRNGAERQALSVELKKILANKSADIPLADGDILFVPVSGSKIWMNKGIDAAISLTTGMLIYNRL
jgi:polysaccharide export outer membrane protein